MDRQWWASYNKDGHVWHRASVGPFNSREEAAKALFAKFPQCKEATTGYGSHGPWFDIRWVKRNEVSWDV